MSVEVIVAVDIVGPVIVDVHMNGNDTVVVIRPVDGSRATARKRRTISRPCYGRGLELLERIVAMLTKMIDH